MPATAPRQGALMMQRQQQRLPARLSVQQVVELNRSEHRLPMRRKAIQRPARQIEGAQHAGRQPVQHGLFQLRHRRQPRHLRPVRRLLFQVDAGQPRLVQRRRKRAWQAGQTGDGL